MSTHALRTSEGSRAPRIVRNLDLAALALSLPVFVAAGLPMLGWGAATGAWLASRFVQSRVERGAAATGDRRSAMRARAISLVGRLYLVGLTVLGAGIVERKAGLAAGVLAVVVFTVYFATLLVAKPVEGRRS